MMHGIPNSRIAKQVDGSSSLNLASSSQCHRSWHQRKLLLFPLRRFFIFFTPSECRSPARPPLSLTKGKLVFGPGPGPGTVCCRAFRSLTAQIIPKRRRDSHVILSMIPTGKGEGGGGGWNIDHQFEPKTVTRKGLRASSPTSDTPAMVWRFDPGLLSAAAVPNITGKNVPFVRMLGPRLWETMGPPARCEHWKLDLKKGCPKAKEGVIDSWDWEAEMNFWLRGYALKDRNM